MQERQVDELIAEPATRPRRADRASRRSTRRPVSHPDTIEYATAARLAFQDGR